jgi:hypothetical protein
MVTTVLPPIAVDLYKEIIKEMTGNLETFLKKL